MLAYKLAVRTNHMYSIYGFGSMLASKGRKDAYTEALRRTVTPRSVVVDIGTGTGIWALLACRFGARKVYAIEPDDVIALARETAALNGLADRIEFIQDLSTRISLPEPADVIVSDIRGILPLHQTSLASLIDARQRLLKPDGVMIPLRDRLWAALTTAPSVHDSYLSPWRSESDGLQMQNIQQRVVNQWKKEMVPAEALVMEPQCWAELEYNTLTEREAHGAVEWTIRGRHAVHGLTLWFDTVLVEGVEFSNAPGMPEQIYGRAFFPWPEEVGVADEDHVAVSLRATPVGNRYVWSWETTVEKSGGDKIHFRQSDFFSEPVSASTLSKQASDYQPMLSEAGEAEQFILGRMDGRTSVESIAREAYERFGKFFGTFPDARRRVSDLSRQFSR